MNKGRVQPWAPLSLRWWPNYTCTWSSSRWWPWIYLPRSPCFGSCIWMTYASLRRAKLRMYSTTSTGYLLPSIRFSMMLERDNSFSSLTPTYPEGMVALLTSLSTENGRTQTGTYTSTPTIQWVRRGQLSEVSSTEPEATCYGRTCRRTITTNDFSA